MSSFKCPIAITAEVAGENPLLICGYKTMSYAQVNNEISATCERLQSLGIGPDDRVVLIDVNTLDLVISIFSLWRLGAVACPLSPRLPDIHLEESIEAIGAKYIISSQNRVFNLTTIKTPKTNFEYIRTQKSDYPDVHQLLEYPFDRESTVILTSGSSASPKAAVLTFGNHFYNAKGANEHIEVKMLDRWLLSLPLYHVSGLSILFRMLLSGGTIVIPEFNEEIDDAIERYQITHVSLVTTQLHRLLHTQKSSFAFKSLKAVLVGGSGIPDSLVLRSLKAGLSIYLTYGLTEMASQVSTSYIPQCDPQSESSIEEALKEIRKTRILEYRSVDIAANDEILVQGETLFSGYTDNNQITLPVDNDGWFHTGDLGEITGDGHLTVWGRKDSMFVSGGENIQPEEIEQCLLQVDGILQAIIVPQEDPEFGSRPVAFLKFDPKIPTEKETILKILKERLPKFKHPENYYRWPEEEVISASIKVSREQFRKLLNENLSNYQLFK